MSLDEQLPTVNWPIKSREYKVVQLELDGDLYLRFADEGFVTHAIILMRLLRDRNVEFTQIKSKIRCDIPALQGERYRVHGMGRSYVNVESKQASFYGHSIDYGIGINRDHIDSIRPLVPDWKLE